MTTPLKKVPIHLQSSQNRIIIKNGSVVNEDGIEKVDIYVEDSRIKQLGNHLIIPGGTKVIDATDKYVIPGGIDANVHFQKPHGHGVTQTIDDFYRGTRAAVIGGTTTVIDCVEPELDESLLDAYNKWKGWAEDKACCDYAFRMAIPKGTVDDGLKQEMSELTREEFGINTFHMSMIGGDKAFKDSADLIEAMSHCKEIGALAQVHAESGEIVAREEKKLLEKGITGPEGFAMAHSEMAEEEAVCRASTVASQVYCPLYVCHMMSTSAAQVLSRKKASGSVLFGETTPAAIACEGDEYWNQNWRYAAGFVCAPPIRRGQKDEMVELLVNSPNEGLDVLASNHCTFNSGQKGLGRQDFTKIPVGVNGTDCRLSVLWERAVHSGKMDPKKFVALTSSIPAKIFNMYPEKGRIEVGADADLVIWNPKTSKKITANDHQLKVDFNIFEGMDCHGVAETVICQGKVMVDEGQIRVMQGFGKFIPLKPFSTFVYDKVRAKEQADSMPRVERSMDDMEITTNGNGGGDIPPPTPPKVNHAVPSPSQHESHFDLRSHPNTPDIDVSRSSPARSSVRVRAPPGGKSHGSFW